MMSKPGKIPAIGIVTIVGVVFTAVKRALGITEDDRRPGGGDLYYEKAVNTEFNGEVRIQVHVQGKDGQNVAASVATGIIKQTKPKFMLLCGIAGGYKSKVKIGDVVVPRVVVDPTKKVAQAGSLLPRPEITAPHLAVLKMLAAARLDTTSWHSRYRSLFPKAIKAPAGDESEFAGHVAKKPSVHEAAISSDNLLLRDGEVLVDQANKLHQQIRAGEMEAAGFVSACNQEYPQIPWYVVRGISDFGDALKNDKFHEMAACAASYVAEFVHSILDLRIWDISNDPTERHKPRWHPPTGDWLIDEVLGKLNLYDVTIEPDAEAYRAMLAGLFRRGAFEPTVLYEDTRSFLFVLYWTRILMNAYLDRLSEVIPSDNLEKVVSRLHKITDSIAGLFRVPNETGQLLDLTRHFEEHSYDKDAFRDGLHGDHFYLGSEQIKARNKEMAALKRLLTKYRLLQK
jgi:nucleoside phosphorylase